MNKETEREHLLTGWWWRPAYPKTLVPGTATVLPDGRLSIDLLDGFRRGVRRSTELSRGYGYFPVLHGIGKNGTAITALQCYYGDVPMLVGKKTSAIVHCHRWILDDLIPENQLTIQEAVIEVEGLRSWSREWSFIDQSFDEGTVTFKAQPRKEYDDINVDLDDCRISIEVRADYKHSHGVSLDVDAKAYFRVRSENGLSIDRFVSVVHRILEFICLARAVGTGIVATHVQNRVGPETEGIRPSPFRPFFDSTMPPPFATDKGMNLVHDHLFTLPDVRESVSDMISAWYGEYSKYKVVVDEYSRIEYADSMAYIDAFLGYVRVLESYHAITEGNSRHVQNEEFLSWVENDANFVFPTSFKKDLRKDIKRTLRMMANSWNLVGKLTRLLKKRSDEVRSRLLGDRNQHDFLTRIAYSRNIFAHGGIPDEQCFQPGSAELRSAISFLRILGQASLLEITGLHKDKIDQLLLQRYSRTP